MPTELPNDNLDERSDFSEKDNPEDQNDILLQGPHSSGPLIRAPKRIIEKPSKPQGRPGALQSFQNENACRSSGRPLYGG